MKNWQKIVLALAAIVMIVVGTIWSSYNRLVALQENTKTAWSNVETTYQRRLDLIPNVVESVKGFVKEEQTVFTEIAEARTRYAGATTVKDRVEAIQNLETGLGRLLAISENYPNLRSSELFTNLMVELEGTENRVQVARRDYNDVALAFNTKIRQFPTNLVAHFLGFSEPQPLFRADEGAEKAPKVNFGS